MEATKATIERANGMFIAREANDGRAVIAAIHEPGELFPGVWVVVCQGRAQAAASMPEACEMLDEMTGGKYFFN